MPRSAAFKHTGREGIDMIDRPERTIWVLFVVAIIASIVLVALGQAL